MITLKTRVIPDEFTAYVSQAFDYTFDGESVFVLPEFDVPASFGLGVIVGSSGSGKTQILIHYFGLFSKPKWSKNKAIVSHFTSPQKAVERLSAAGLSSIPTMCKPYHVLSTGEAYRADVARMIRDGAVIDEYTSVVNRETAKSLSVALRKYIRTQNLKDVVLATCHRDVLDWLEPDWVFDTDVRSLYPNEYTGNLKRVGYYEIY